MIKKRVTKELAAQRVCTKTVQNEIKGVLDWVATGAAQRIFNSPNPSSTESCVCCSKNETLNNKNDKKARFLSEY